MRPEFDHGSAIHIAYLVTFGGQYGSSLSWPVWLQSEVRVYLNERL